MSAARLLAVGTMGIMLAGCTASTKAVVQDPAEPLNTFAARVARSASMDVLNHSLDRLMNAADNSTATEVKNGVRISKYGTSPFRGKEAVITESFSDYCKARGNRFQRTGQAFVCRKINDDPEFVYELKPGNSFNEFVIHLYEEIEPGALARFETGLFLTAARRDAQMRVERELAEFRRKQAIEDYATVSFGALRCATVLGLNIRGVVENKAGGMYQVRIMSGDGGLYPTGMTPGSVVWGEPVNWRRCE